MFLLLIIAACLLAATFWGSTFHIRWESGRGWSWGQESFTADDLMARSESPAVWRFLSDIKSGKAEYRTGKRQDAGTIRIMRGEPEA